jgi:cytochrome c biogenesis protein ResB
MVPFTLLEIISSTGLQIKTDLGIPIIYGGFFLLMISTL